MKRLILCSFLISAFLTIGAQQMGILKNQKDAWGNSYTYVGHISGGKPDGMGMALYPSGKGIKYAGQFQDGLFNGEGVLILSGGTFEVGGWTRGVATGKGASYNTGGFFHVGQYNNDKRDGYGVRVAPDNSFVIGNFAKNQANGRAIYVRGDGRVIMDVNFVNDVIHGKGYQFEAANSTLFRGEWNSNQWIGETNPGFSTLLENFKARLDENEILMGGVNDSKRLQDSAFAYDLVNHRRYFGNYSDGVYKGGLIIEDDKSRFLGRMDNEGNPAGLCYNFRIGSFFAQGDYSPNGVITDYVFLDLENDLVYFGHKEHNKFNGAGTLFTKEKEMYRGQFKDDVFQFGYMLDSNGRKIDGWWDDGQLTKIDEVIRPDGTKMFLKPETLEGLVNVVMSDHPHKFLNLVGTELEGDEGDRETRYFESLISCPLFENDQIVLQKNSTHLYMIEYWQSDDPKEAIEKYNELTRKLPALKLTNKAFTKPTKLSGKVNVVTNPEVRTETKFTLLPVNTFYKDFNARVKFDKTREGKYRVQLQLGTIK